MADGDKAGDETGPEARARVSPWPDRIALILIWLAGIVITILYQRPKGAGLYGEFWFGAMITVAMLIGYVATKRALGYGPVVLKLRRPRKRGG